MRDTAVNEVVTAVRGQVAAALAAGSVSGRPLVLAVSGGRDSVVLFDAVLAVAAVRVAGVATFDHGTGAGARAAVRHVRALGRAAGVRVCAGRAQSCAPSEAAWRLARWRYLRRVARVAVPPGAPPALVATGHTADDQLETVLMRVFRGAGARGLAGMEARTLGIVRPLLGVTREQVAAYAAARRLAWIEDASNASRAHLRNRVRHEMLPAVRRARPAFVGALDSVAHAAAGWRAEVDAVAAALVHHALAEGPPREPLAPSLGAEPSVAVPVARLAGYDEAALAVLWPALAARAGVALDRRGTARLAAFTKRCVAIERAGQVPLGEVPLAARAVVTLERLRDRSPERAMVLRRRPREPSRHAELAVVALAPSALPDGVRFGRWHFAAAASPGEPTPEATADDPWRVCLDAARRYVVRAWRPGDRMRSGGAARRVKRFLADRRVPAAERAGWPVVVALPDAVADAVDGEIVWIPGVRRSPAAPARPGLPGLVLHCTRRA